MNSSRIFVDSSQEAIRATKAHLDSSFDLFLKTIHTKSDQGGSMLKALRTLGKASKMIFGLACPSEGDEAKKKRHSKKRRTNESLSSASSGNESESGSEYEPRRSVSKSALSPFST